jgi:hypothetical protein
MNMAVIIQTVYDELVEYLATKATPQEILNFQISEAAQARAEELLERNSDNTLTPDERLELEQMRYFDRKVSLLKAEVLANRGQ